MIIERLIIKNFKAIEEADLDLANKDMIGIIGKYEIDPERSNGAGKSSLLESILFALYKYDPRSNSQFIGMYADYCEVTVVFRKNNKKYSVTRYLDKKGNHKILIKENDNEIKGGIKELQEYIGKIVGIYKPNLMLYINFFSRESNKILTATPSERVEILTKDLLNLNRYKKYRKIIYDKKSKVENDIAYKLQEIENIKKSIKELEIQMGNITEKHLQTEIETLRKEITQLMEKEREYIALIERASSMANIVEQIKGLTQQKEILTTSINANKKALEEYINKQKGYNYNIEMLQKEIENLKDKFKTHNNKLIDAVNDDVQEIKEKLINGLNNIISKKNELIQLQSNVNATETLLKERITTLSTAYNKCPVCNNDLPSEKKEELLRNMYNELSLLQQQKIELEEELKSIEKSEKNIQEKITSLDYIIKTIENKQIELNIYKKDLPAIEEQIKNLSNAIHISELSLNEIEKQLNDLKSQQDNIQYLDVNKLKKQRDITLQLIEEKRAMIDDIKEKLLNIQNIQQQIQKLNKVIENNQQEIEKLQYKLKIYSILYDAFGSEGIQTFLIEEVMKYVEIDANNILKEIDPTKEIKVIIEKTGKDTDEIGRTIDFEIKYLPFNQTMKFIDYSEGEMLYINFALRLALSKFLTEQTSPVKFIVLDDIVSKLDKVKRIEILKILYHLREYFEQIFFTSHIDLTTKFPYIIEVIKDRNERSKATIYYNSSVESFYEMLNLNTKLKED